MAWPLRILSSKRIYHVCSRTRESRIWFLPTEKFETTFGGILARTAERYQIKVYGYQVLGNHFHLLLQGQKKRIPKFMKDLKSAMAAATKRMYGWEDGKLWYRRYDCEVVFEDKLVHMFCYVNANAVSTNLVAQGSDYKGLSGYHQAISGMVPEYIWTDWARYRKDKARAGRYKRVDIKDYQQRYKLPLTILPIWKHLSKEALLVKQKGVLQDYERACAKLRQAEGKAVLGPAGLSRVKAGSRPHNTKKAPRPQSHTACPKRRNRYSNWYRAITAEYRETSKKFLGGLFHIKFPIWTFRPPAWMCEG